MINGRSGYYGSVNEKLLVEGARPKVDVNNCFFIVNTLFFCVLQAGRTALFPFLPLYFRELGLTAPQTGMLCGIRAILQVFSGIVWVSLFRRCQNPYLFKFLLILSLVVSTACSLCLVIVPKQLEVAEDSHCKRNITDKKSTGTRAVREIVEDEEGKHVINRNTTQKPQNEKLVNELELSELFGSMYKYNSTDNTDNGYGYGGNSGNLFLAFLGIILVESLLSANVEKLADDSINCFLDNRDENNRHGFYELYRCLSSAISAIIFSILISDSTGLCKMNFIQQLFAYLYVSHYKPLFFVFACFMFITMLTAIALPYCPGLPPLDVGRCFRLLKLDPSFRIILYSACVFFMGITHANIYVFLLWKLHGLGTQDYVIGSMVATAAASEIFMHMFGKEAIRRYSLSRIIAACIFCQILRLFYYAFLSEPWSAIPFEVLYMFTNTLLWICIYNYIEFICVPETVRDAYFVVQTSFWGLGYGLGCILGGRVYHQFGPDILLLSVAGLLFLWFIFYFAFIRCCQTDTGRKVRGTLKGYMLKPRIETNSAHTAINDMPLEMESYGGNFDSDPTLDDIASKRGSRRASIDTRYHLPALPAADSRRASIQQKEPVKTTGKKEQSAKSEKKWRLPRQKSSKVLKTVLSSLHLSRSQTGADWDGQDARTKVRGVKSEAAVTAERRKADFLEEESFLTNSHPSRQLPGINSISTPSDDQDSFHSYLPDSARFQQRSADTSTRSPVSRSGQHHSTLPDLFPPQTTLTEATPHASHMDLVVQESDYALKPVNKTASPAEKDKGKDMDQSDQTEKIQSKTRKKKKTRENKKSASSKIRKIFTRSRIKDRT